MNAITAILTSVGLCLFAAAPGVMLKSGELLPPHTKHEETADRPVGCKGIREWQLPAGDVVHGRDLPPNDVLVTRARLNLVAQVAEHLCRSSGAYPTSLAAIAQYSAGLARKKVCILDDAAFVDAWGRPFSVSGDARGIRISSDGPDARPHTSDDIAVPPPSWERSLPSNWRVCDARGTSD